MALIAEFSLPTDSFALGASLEEFPNVAVELDRIAAHVPDSTMPALWATGDEVDEFADAVPDDPTVREVRATSAFAEDCLLQIEWSDDINRLVTEMIDHEGVILEASGTATEWRIRIRFMTRQQFDGFRRYFDEHSPEFTLRKLFEAKHPRHTRGDVTPDQHEALLTAEEMGYFAIPREASINDVAEAMELSDQAVSERIRRGTGNLVRDMLTVSSIQRRN